MPIINKFLNEEEKEKLVILNTLVKQVLLYRKTWLDKKMFEHSPIQIGDTIRDRQTDKILGIVTNLFRTEEYDDNLSYIYYEYKGTTILTIDGCSIEKVENSSQKKPKEENAK